MFSIVLVVFRFIIHPNICGINLILLFCHSIRAAVHIVTLKLTEHSFKRIEEGIAWKLEMHLHLINFSNLQTLKVNDESETSGTEQQSSELCFSCLFVVKQRLNLISSFYHFRR